jgi:hypothetical protein
LRSGLADADWAAVLNTVGPALAKVGCDDHWRSGFVIEPSLVVTTIDAVTAHCEPEVRVGNDVSIAVEVVSWSQSDRLAILRLATPVESRPLRPHGPDGPLRVGDEVAIVAAGVDYTLASEESGIWRAPRVRWGRVGATTPTLVIDATLAPSDIGAPLLSSTGDVVGIIVASDAPQGPIVGQPWAAVSRLADSVGRQGTFAKPWKVGGSVGLMFSSRPREQQIGIYMPSGVTFDWLAVQAGVGIWGREALPAPQQRIEKSSAVGIELEANARYMPSWRTYLLAGVGVQAIGRTKRTWPIGDEKAAQYSKDNGALAFVSLAAGIHFLQWRVVAGLTEPEVRLETGLVLGRN